MSNSLLPPMQSIIFRVLGFLFVKTVKQGAQTTIYCAVSEDMEGVSGKYLADCRIQPSKGALADNAELEEKLWEVSAQMVGL